jgi:Protein of unknown function (DUF3558)
VSGFERGWPGSVPGLLLGNWAAVLVSALGTLAVGCSTYVSGAPTWPVVIDASQVDMCTILSDGELAKLGIRLDSREPFDEAGVVGCQWVGNPFTLSMDRDNNTLASYQPRRDDPIFVSFADNTVNDRTGIQLVLDRGGSRCTQLIDGGPVSLTVSVAAASNLGSPINSCAEALRIAQLIEPRLPEVRK